MAIMTYAEFKTEYQSGYGLATSTQLSDAYRQYQLTGVLPGATVGTTAETTTPTTTTPADTTTATPNSFAWWLETYHPGSHTSEELIELNREYVDWYNTQAFPPTPTTPTTTVPTTPTLPTEPPKVPPITVPTITMPPVPTPPVLPEVPTLEPPIIPEVPEVPPYEKLPAQVALEEEYTEALREWREAGGYGIPEEVQAQMIQRATDILKSREAESIRVMRNNMERRGITNSGFVFANEMTIKSNTTLAIANSITDVQINSALMKMASFEKMMGSTAQFIGYLAQESWKTYQPKMAQWEMEARYGLAGYEVAARYGLSQAELEARYGLAEYGVAAEYGIAGYQAKIQATMAQFQANTLAVMTEWQGKMDLWKMEINQAYTQGNMDLAAQIAADAAAQQHLNNIELAEMEIEAAQQAAMAEGAGNLLGTASGAIATIIAK